MSRGRRAEPGLDDVNDVMMNDDDVNAKTWEKKIKHRVKKRNCYSARCLYQAAEGAGGAALRPGGEGEGGGGAEERDRLGQEGGASSSGAAGGNREREEPAEIRGGGAGAGRGAGVAFITLFVRCSYLSESEGHRCDVCGRCAWL